MSLTEIKLLKCIKTQFLYLNHRALELTTIWLFKETMHIFSNKDMCQCACRHSVLEAEPIHSIFPFYICAVYSLKQVVNGLWLHRPCLSTLRWTLKDLSVDGERDYGEFMVVFVHFSADCSSDPPLDWSLARLAVLRQTSPGGVQGQCRNAGGLAPG